MANPVATPHADDPLTEPDRAELTAAVNAALVDRRPPVTIAEAFAAVRGHAAARRAQAGDV